MDKMSSKEGKWDCTACTYRNFIVSRKCIMCGTVRPSHVSADLENSEQDIYKVAELDATRNQDSSFCLGSDSLQVWVCKKCTFKNGIDKKKCVECLLPRDLEVEPVDSLKEEVKVQNSTSKPTLSLICPPNVTSKSVASDKILPKSPSTKGLIIAKLLKWPCKLCTFENHSKSLKCTMCLNPREYLASEEIKSPVIGSPGSSLMYTLPLKIDVHTKNQENIDVNTKNQENIRSGQNSPNRNAHVELSQSQSPNEQSGKDNNRSSSNKNCSENLQNLPASTPHSPTVDLHCNSISNKVTIIPYSFGQKSPKQTSPKNNRSGQSSPQEIRSGHSSPISGDSPIVQRSIKSNRNLNQNQVIHVPDGAGAIGGCREDDRLERKLKKIRKKLTTEDLVWLNACEGVVNGDLARIDQYLTTGGDPTRQLTKDEVLLLDRPSAFEVGYTLVHLALRFRRDDMVAILLAATDITSKGFKRLPSYICPDLSANIRRDIRLLLRQKKGTFPCYFFENSSTFSLPADIEDLPRHVQTQLFDEILDTDVEKELNDELVINWSTEITEKLGSRLYALWNRTAGDCLLDSVLQATWGILDIDNTLRGALASTLHECGNCFYHRWKEYEKRQADLLKFTLDESQWQRDWALLLKLASQPGASLEQLHIFALAHILRRPIIIYGVKVVKSFRGESIDFARFEGVYLPFLWERNFCYKSPITLGYTRGHFSALVPMELDTNMPLGAGANIDNAPDEQVFYLPLVDHEGVFLPIHFISGAEANPDETIFRRWFDCIVTQEGHFVAIQHVGKCPIMVKQMLDVWLDHYRQKAASSDADNIGTQGFSTDGDSDQD